MGTLNEKLEYLSQTKEYIKEAIISKGQPVSSSDTFRSYASKIAAIENGDIITATNTTGSAVSANDRVWIEPNVSGEVRNFTVNGNPTINDGTKSISNFSGDNFILFPSINFNEAESWEIHTKFLYDPQASGSNETYLSGGGWSFQVRTNNPSRCTYLLMSSDGESWNLANNLHGSQQLTAGNTYYMKFLFTGSRYELWLSSDGINYTLDSQVSSSNKINQTSETIILGSLGVTNVSSYVRGTIDLNETYTIANNRIVWTSYKPQIVGYGIISPNSVTENSFTAVAQTSIANNASGSVKTILDGNGTYAPTLGTKVITRNNTYSASTDDLYGYSSVTVNVEDIPAVVESLSITPTTSAQSFTPTSGVDGYSPVTVSAVDSSIDANITAGNIKSGVEILGVTGEYSGETPVLEDKVITSNGTYSASTGYDGIGEATVAVNATGDTETCINRTGAAISNGDKVWINQEYYEAGQVTTNTFSNTLPSYTVRGLNCNCYGDKLYVTLTTTPSTSGFKPHVYDCSGTDLGELVQMDRYADYYRNSYEGYDYRSMKWSNSNTPKIQRVDNGSGWSKVGDNSNCYSAIPGTSRFIHGGNIVGGGNLYYGADSILEINPETGEILNTFVIENSYGAIFRKTVYIGNDLFLACCSRYGYTNSYTFGLRLNRSNNSVEVVSSYHSATSTIGLSSVYVIGITSDYKYLLCSDNKLWDISDLSNVVERRAEFFGDVTIYNWPAQDTINSSYNWSYFNGNFDTYISTIVDSSSTGYPTIVKLLVYHPENGNWETITYEKEWGNESNVICGIDIKNKKLKGFFYYNVGNSDWQSKFSYMAIDSYVANNLVPSGLFNSVTGSTGTAAENIAVGGSGNVYVGIISKLQHEKIIRQNGTYTADTGYDGIASVDVAIGQIGGTYEAENITSNTYQENDKVWLNYRQMRIENSSLNNKINGRSWSGNSVPFVCDATTSNLYYNSFESGSSTFGVKYNLIDNTQTQVAEMNISAYQGSRFTYIEDNIPCIIRKTGTNNGDYSTTKVTDEGLSYLPKQQLGYGFYLDAYSNNTPAVYFPDGTASNISGYSFKVWEHNDKYYLSGDVSSANRVYLIDTENKSLTWLTTTPSSSGGYWEISTSGITSDGKYLVRFTVGEPTNYSTSIINIDYQNNSCALSLVTDSKLPASAKSLLSSYCCSWFNPQNDTLIIAPLTITNINQMVICKYNQTTEVFDDITSQINLPNSSITLYTRDHGSARFSMWLSTDYKTLIFADVSAQDSYKSYNWLNVYYMDNAEGWVITNYNNINQDSLTGYAAETIAAGATGDVIIGEEIENQNKSITSDGSYTADEGYTGLGTVTVTAGAVASAATQNQIAEELMLINDGAVALTVNVSPTTADFVLTSSTNHIDIIPTSSSGGTYIFNISANNLKNYTYSASELGYTTSTGTIVGGTSTFTITLDEESESE